jgi:hypothetical protein
VGRTLSNTSVALGVSSSHSRHTPWGDRSRHLGMSGHVSSDTAGDRTGEAALSGTLTVGDGGIRAATRQRRRRVLSGSRTVTPWASSHSASGTATRRLVPHACRAELRVNGWTTPARRARAISAIPGAR